MDHLNKENLCLPSFHIFSTPNGTKRKSTLESRTPLQDVNVHGPRSGALRKLHYTPGTPLASTNATGKTPRRKCKSLLASENQENTGTLKKLVNILESSKQEYETKLREHEAYIANLEQKLVAMDVTQVNDRLRSVTNNSVRQVIDSAMNTSPIREFNVATDNMETNSRELINAECNTSPLRYILSENIAVGTECIEMCSVETVMAPLSIKHLECNTANVPIVDSCVGPDSPQQCNAETMTSPRVFANAESNTGSRAYFDDNTGLEHGSYISMSTQTVLDENTGPQTNINEITDPKPTSSSSISTQTELDVNMGPQTDFNCNIGTQTDLDSIAGIETDLNENTCSQTNSTQTDSDVNTVRINYADSNTGPSHNIQELESSEPSCHGAVMPYVTVGTAVTPRKTVDRGCVTSPERLFSGRPSDVGLASLSENALRTELEAAAVSNTLLREQLKQLQGAHNQLQRSCDQLQRSRDQLQVTDDRLQAELLESRDQLQYARDQLQETRDQLQETRDQLQQLRNETGDADANLAAAESETETLKLESAAAAENHATAITWYKEKLSAAQKDLVAAYRSGKEQMEAAKHDAEEYKRLYHDTVVRCVVAEKRLEPFLSLGSVLQENKLKVVTAKSAMVEVRDSALTQIAALRRERAQLVEPRQATEKIRDLERRVRDLQAARKNTMTDIQALEVKCQQLESEKEQLQEQLTSVTSQLQSRDEQLKSLTSQLQSRNEQLTSVTSQLQSRDKQLTSVTSQLLSRDERLNSMTSQLESRDQQLNQLQGQLRSVTSHAQSFQRQLYEAQTKMQSVLTDAQDFHESEMSAAKERFTEVKVKYEAVKGKYARLSQQAQEYQEKLATARYQVQELEGELGYTKTSAHLMLLQQNRELTESKLGLDRLAALVLAVRVKLAHRLPQIDESSSTDNDSTMNSRSPENTEPTSDRQTGKETNNLTLNDSNNQAETSTTSQKTETTTVSQTQTPTISQTSNQSGSPRLTQGEMDQDPEGPPGSFLSAVMRSLGTTSKEQNAEAFDDAADSAPVVGSAGSAFTRVGVSAQIQSNGESTKNKIDAETSADGSDLYTLTDQVEDVYSELLSVTGLLKQLETAFAKQHDVLQTQLSEHSARLEATTANHEQTVAALNAQLHDAQQTEVRMREEVRHLRGRLTETAVGLAMAQKLGEEQAERLRGVADNSTRVQELTSEVARLERRLTAAKENSALLREQLESALGGEKGSGREVYLLRTEVNKLRFELIEARSEAEELASKANNRQRLLTQNLRSAEQEIVALDDTVERLRQVLRKHASEVRHWPEMGSIWMEIIYDNRVDDPATEWPGSCETPCKQVDSY